MRRQGVADNPVLVGAGAILVILVMVLLSYNANTGLPFVPTYNITADLPNGAALVKGNEVKIGGARAGLVTSITPVTVDGKYQAQIAMKLDKNVGPIPANSKVEVRPRSTIGLKYVELTLGDSKETIPNGGNLPISQASIATEFEDLLNTFDERVREGNKQSLNEFGNAFAGRGTDLNTAFGEIGPLFANLEPVARTISARGTRLTDFIRALARAARDTAATGDEAGEVFVNADRTMEAFANASTGIQESLEESPPTLAVLTESFPEQQRYFTQLTGLVEKFQPGAPYLPAVADNLANITVNGPRAMKKLYRTTPKFNTTFQNLGQFSADPQVRLGFQGLASFVSTINQPLSYITPAQTVCNYFGLFARNIASSVGSRDSGYGWLRFSAVAGWPSAAAGQNAEVGPANGLASFSNRNSFGQDTSNFLQANPYPTTGQNGLCGAGNEVTLGSKSGSTDFRLPQQVRTQQPSQIKPGSKTENSEAVGTEQIKK